MSISKNHFLNRILHKAKTRQFHEESDHIHEEFTFAPKDIEDVLLCAWFDIVESSEGFFVSVIACEIFGGNVTCPALIVKSNALGPN